MLLGTLMKWPMIKYWLVTPMTVTPMTILGIFCENVQSSSAGKNYISSTSNWLSHTFLYALSIIEKMCCTMDTYKKNGYGQWSHTIMVYY